MRTQTLTILISDLQGYTARQARSSREEIGQDLARHRELLVPIFRAFRGDVIKTMGDAFLVAFESPTDAVLAAAQVQKQLAVHNASLEDPVQAQRVRIALVTGEVARDEGSDVFGEPVNLAARMQSVGEPGSVWLSETTFLAMNRNEVQALEVGARVFKGIPGEVKVYRLLDEFIRDTRLLTKEELARALQPLEREIARTGRRARVLLVLVSLLVLAGVVVVVALVQDRRDPRDPRTPLERFTSDPSDVQSADAWLAEVEEQLYEAERLGTMQALYREGRMVAQLDAHAARLAQRPAFLRARAVWVLANEPLAPGAPETAMAAIAASPSLKSDPRFRKLLADTVAYAQKDPGAQQLYRRAMALLEQR